MDSEYLYDLYFDRVTFLRIIRRFKYGGGPIELGYKLSAHLDEFLGERSKDGVNHTIHYSATLAEKDAIIGAIDWLEDS